MRRAQAPSLMRSVALAVLALALAAPAGQACSLAFQPYDQASFHDDGLWFVEGDGLLHVDGLIEAREAEGFFLTYARLADGGLLVAGQDGLGADCSGDAWLELRDGDGVRWREEEGARVFPHALGPFVQRDRELLRLVDGELAAYGTLPQDSYIIGWTTDGLPVVRDRGGLRFGARTLDLPSGDEPDVAEHDGLLGVAEAIWDNQAEAYRDVVLHIVDGAAVTNVSWEVPGGWGAGIAWAGGWLVAAGGRAYLVTDAVTDLGVDEARAVAHRGGQGVVFTDDGYVVFDGTRPVEAWDRNPATGVWRPVAAETEPPRVVAASHEGPGPWVGEASGSGSASSPPADDGAFTIPAVGPMLLAFAALALAAARRR
jgi:hypothetical protein